MTRTIAITVTAEQARFIYDHMLVVTGDEGGDYPVESGNWREFYRLAREDASNTAAVVEKLDGSVSLLEQLEAQRDFAEVELTVPRELLESIAAGLANVAPEVDRREVRAGLDLLDALDATPDGGAS